MSCSLLHRRKELWLSSVKGILNECGLAYIWNTQTFQKTARLKLYIKQALKDQFIQLLLSLIQNSPKLLTIESSKNNSKLKIICTFLMTIMYLNFVNLEL